MFLEDNIMKYYEGFSKKYLRSGATITEVFLYKKNRKKTSNFLMADVQNQNQGFF